MTTYEKDRENLIAEAKRLYELCRWREGQVRRAIAALGHGEGCRCVVCTELWEFPPKHLGEQAGGQE